MTNKEQSTNKATDPVKNRLRQKSSPDLSQLGGELLPESIVPRAKTNPSSLTPRDMMQLQRTIGNQAVVRLFATGIQDSTIDDRQQGVGLDVQGQKTQDPMLGIFKAVKQAGENSAGRVTPKIQRRPIGATFSHSPLWLVSLRALHNPY